MIRMNAGARTDVMWAVPFLQELARREYCLGMTLLGEYSHLCLRFIRECIYRASAALDALPEGMVTEAVMERSRRVVKAARWFGHDILFRVGAILSAPYVNYRLIGSHVDVDWDNIARVGRGDYVVFEAEMTYSTAMYAWGRARRTRSGDWVVYPAAMGGGERFRVGSMPDLNYEYHGLVGMVWDSHWETGEEEYLLDADTLARDLVYNVVILGSTRVFAGAEWDVLYHHLLWWAATNCLEVW